MTVQQRNSEMVNLLSADFQGRYEPQFALANTMALIQALPGLRGFWPMSGYDSNLAATDMSGLGHHLTRSGNPQYDWAGLAPYLDFDGTGDYLSITDAASNNDFDILGNEDVANPGLTIYTWVWLDDDTAVQALVAKDDGTIAGRNYFLNFRGGAGDQARLLVANGGSQYFVDSSDVLATETWYLIVGRFVPSTSVDVYVGSTTGLSKTSETTSIPATINNSAAPLEIGGRGGAVLLDGRQSMGAVCAAAHSDTIIGNIFQQSRALVGV